jgi:lipopolysaccharide export system protein LptA
MAKWCAYLLVFWASVAVAAPALDSDKPIDISADSLEVRQQEKQAIFSGNVVAKQGNIKMQAAKMLVFYDGQAGEGDAPNSISKIEAEGGVVFVSPSETARGGRAIYDVNKEQIRMIGNVTLTREQSVLKGSALVYSFKTGRSVLTSGASGGDGGPRVRGLFVPSGEK